MNKAALAELLQVIGGLFMLTANKIDGTLWAYYVWIGLVIWSFLAFILKLN